MQMKNRKLSFDKSSPETQTYIRNRDKCHSNKFILAGQISITHANGNKGEAYTKIPSRNIKQRTWNFKVMIAFSKRKSEVLCILNSLI